MSDLSIDGLGDGSAENDTQLDRQDRRKKHFNAATGASAAGVRALSAQAFAFWFRAPAKAFIPTRIEVTDDVWSWHKTTPGLLTHAVRSHGWRFIPEQVLPPMLANVFAGAVLYTTYLQTLTAFHEPTKLKRAYPPPPSSHTLTAGFVAGFVQSIVAAPLDALQVRFETHEVLEGHYENMWDYGKNKLKEIGARGIFSGWALTMFKDSFGAALFFCSFETIKSQWYYSFVTKYYSSLNAPGVQRKVTDAQSQSESEGGGGIPSIHPHYAIEPLFLTLAGAAASLTSQVIHYPLGIIQDVYYERLERIDKQASKAHGSWKKMMKHHQEAYRELYTRCKYRASQYGGWRSFLYGGFWANIIKAVPSTSAGLIIFELVRRKYGIDTEPVLIKNEGYNVLLV
ncbi:hypothetical protein KEM54_006316 [Ascosphaera aggregata]|nr:hypothetical protein KEM54_006316 [Ascosphaera aggregata]